jgi:hypothetical protein
MNEVHQTRSFILTAAVGIAMVTTPVLADTVSVAPPTTFPSVVPLSTGTSDWVHYGAANNSSANYGTPVQDSPATGTNFSMVSSTGTSQPENYTFSTKHPSFTWTNGTPDSTGNTRSTAFVFIDSAPQGLAFTLAVAAHSSETLNVYADSYQGGNSLTLNTTLTATLQTSGISGTYTGMLPAGVEPDDTIYANHEWGVYAVSVSNTSASSELLAVQLTQSNGSTVGLIGATVTAVPEPSAFPLLPVAGTGLFLIFRRRKAA